MSLLPPLLLLAVLLACVGRLLRLSVVGRLLCLLLPALCWVAVGCWGLLRLAASPGSTAVVLAGVRGCSAVRRRAGSLLVAGRLPRAESGARAGGALPGVSAELPCLAWSPPALHLGLLRLSPQVPLLGCPLPPPPPRLGRPAYPLWVLPVSTSSPVACRAPVCDGLPPFVPASLVSLAFVFAAGRGVTGAGGFCLCCFLPLSSSTRGCRACVR